MSNVSKMKIKFIYQTELITFTGKHVKQSNPIYVSFLSGNLTKTVAVVRNGRKSTQFIIEHE